MEIYRFEQAIADAMSLYGSHDIHFVRVLKSTESVNVAVMYIGQGGLVGYHAAVGDQLFMVVKGLGWVAGADRVQRDITVGQAAFWRDSEWHESGSASGMVALIIEAPSLDPSKFLQPHQPPA